MKKFMSMLAIALIFASCSDDDDNDSSDALLTGTYNLTFFGGETPVDFNGDGNASANLITETGCYSGDNIVFSSNDMAVINSTTFADIEVIVENGNSSFDITCVSDPSSDAVTFTQSGSTVTIIQAGADFSGTIDGDMLTFTVPSGSVVEVINDDGTTATLIEDLTLVYEEQ